MYGMSGSNFREDCKRLQSQTCFLKQHVYGLLPLGADVVCLRSPLSLMTPEMICFAKWVFVSRLKVLMQRCA